MSIGDPNPLPFVLGDEPTPCEAAYASLRAMVGINGSGAEGTIEAEWRWSRAHALGALSTFDERAMAQSSPLSVTDWLPQYEEMLGIVVDEGKPVELRRDVVAYQYTRLGQAFYDALTAHLARIEPTVQLVTIPTEKASSTMPGLPFEPFAVEEGYEYDPRGRRKATRWPNYSDAYRVTCVVPHDSGVLPSIATLARMTHLRDTLAVCLPAWVTFDIVTRIGGFVLDSDLLDLTTF